MYSYQLSQSVKNPVYCFIDKKRVSKKQYEDIQVFADRQDSFVTNKGMNHKTIYISFEYNCHKKPIDLFGNYVDFYVYQDDIDLMPTTGHCDYACEQISSKSYVKRQLEDKAEKITKELYEYGAWSDDELRDKQENIKRLLWIMIGDYKEQQF